MCKPRTHRIDLNSDVIYIERKNVLKPSFFEKNHKFLEFSAEYMIFFWYADSQLSSQKP
ncbi:hypothetical protein HMPREF0733_10419 [Rothia dentocariosa ATCC 17931]|uniref:Uncharacterized protein n=1 Tax=Rothia dentocariosa (strain ATCC 17931 / CDC X599 / XDIA) TaxID=762948 RepID=E3H070_ROTDC|nr:hypothetical protein HMPREF0733_10419 [Rothia dentocariosa ATCC 17931]SUE37310.1 Uncharacterised protein [Rothia dentocariosa]